MKQIVINVICLMSLGIVLSSCSWCTMQYYPCVTIINKTEDTIDWDLNSEYPDSLFPMGCEWSEWTFPGDTCVLMSVYDRKTIFKKCPYFYVFGTDRKYITLKGYDYADIRARNLYAVKYRIDQEYVDKHGWVIVYEGNAQSPDSISSSM